MIFAICAVLALGTVALYAPVRHYEFLNYDDDDYVSDNPHVLGGFTRENVVYAIAHFHSSNWHPLTWFSHMADAELWGDRAGGHHLTNLLFHTANTVLLFLLFVSLTSNVWRSAFVAAVFAWHPLHVESVAWISERKDLLCGFFWILTTAAYLGYVHRRSLPRYALVVFLFVCGLMSKPMIVTLPFVLLLLDYWPLQRADLTRTDLRRRWFDLFLEKTPLLLLAIIAGRLTISTQGRTGALKSALEFPWLLRLENAPISYVQYLGKAIWPVKLAVLYPLPNSIPLWEPCAATLLLIVVTIMFFKGRTRSPYLLMGWGWFLGTLIPVLGLVQVGSQAMADRYMYLPLIGLAVAFAWGGWELVRFHPQRRAIVALVFLTTSALMMQASARQLRYWQNSITLFQRAVAETSDNGIAYGNLSAALLARSRPDEAAAAAQQAIRILPNHPVGYLSLGMSLLAKRRPVEAIANLEKAVELQPDWPDAQQDLGGALAMVGRTNDALTHFYEALKVSPYHVAALKAIAWIRATQSDDALRDSKEALELAERAVSVSQGNDPQTLDVLAAALAEAGRYDEAVERAEQAKARALALHRIDFANEVAARIDFYRLHLPYRAPR